MMNSIDVKRLILATALHTQVQGMIADNKDCELQEFTLSYTDNDFENLADQIRNIATMTDDEVLEHIADNKNK